MRLTDVCIVNDREHARETERIFDPGFSPWSSFALCKGNIKVLAKTIEILKRELIQYGCKRVFTIAGEGSVLGMIISAIMGLRQSIVFIQPVFIVKPLPRKPEPSVLVDSCIFTGFTLSMTWTKFKSYYPAHSNNLKARIVGMERWVPKGERKNLFLEGIPPYMSLSEVEFREIDEKGLKKLKNAKEIESVGIDRYFHVRRDRTGEIRDYEIRETLATIKEIFSVNKPTRNKKEMTKLVKEICFHKGLVDGCFILNYPDLILEICRYFWKEIKDCHILIGGSYHSEMLLAALSFMKLANGNNESKRFEILKTRRLGKRIQDVWGIRINKRSFRQLAEGLGENRPKVVIVESMIKSGVFMERLLETLINELEINIKEDISIVAILSNERAEERLCTSRKITQEQIKSIVRY